MLANTLPFPRGQTWCDGQVTPDATTAKQLLGKVYEVTDSVHLTGRTVKLRVVKNDGSALTVARKAVAYGTAALDFGRYIKGYNASAGGSAVLIDNAYAVGQVIAASDLFYVIEEGPTTILSSSAAATFAAQAELAVAAGGRLTTVAATTGQFSLGRIDEACATTSATVVVHAHPPNQT